MLVDGSKREEKGAIEDVVEIRNTVKDGYEVGEACDKADNELGEDGFGDIFTWPSEGLIDIVTRVMKSEDPYLGISSARCVITSGVPTE